MKQAFILEVKMTKVWRFLSVAVVLAVCLGLMLVPAMGISAGEPGAGKVTFLLPAEVEVTPGEAFAVNVTIYNPNTINIYSAGCDLVWSTPSMLGVSSIDGISWPTVLLTGWDNTTGEAYVSAGGSIASPYQNTTNISQCTVHFVAGSSEGVVTLNFTPGIEGETVVYDVHTDDLCNWSAMQNMTVRIGSPTLTVNVTPAGNGTVKANGVTLTGYPNTTNRSWDEVVQLNATTTVPNWTFDHWSGNLNGTTNPTNITMSGNKNVTAHFASAAAGATLEGHVSFTGRGSNNTKWAELFNVTLFEAGNLTHVLWTGNATTNNTGVFTITGVTSGTYDIGIKNWTCLSEVNASVTLTAGNTTVVNFGTTREGDCDNNDHINILDASFLASRFGSSEGGPGWSPLCDFNRDANINILDASALASNFGQGGDLT
jgi:hypothetical protein